MSHPNTAVTLRVRIPPEMRDQLDALSGATGRTRSLLAIEAIENYLSIQSWQVKAIKKSVKKADSKDARFIDHHKIVEWASSWNSEGEKEMP